MTTGVRLGQGLQPGGEVRRFPDDQLLQLRSFADQIADDHHPGGDPDARLELDGFDIEATNSPDDTQSRSDGPLGIVLVRSRVAEIDENTVPHVLGDKPVEAPDDIGNGAVIGGDDLVQILGIEPRGERSRTDQIAEHHAELPALGAYRTGRNLLAGRRGDWRCFLGGRSWPGRLPGKRAHPRHFLLLLPKPLGQTVDTLGQMPAIGAERKAQPVCRSLLFWRRIEISQVENAIDPLVTLTRKQCLGGLRQQCPQRLRGCRAWPGMRQ